MMMPPVVYLYPETSTSVGPMALEVAPGSTMKEMGGRIGRTRLLDGTVYYDNRGLTDGDRTFRLRTRLTAAQTEALRGLMTTAERFFLSAEEAVWLGHIAKITDSGADAIIEFWPANRAADASSIVYPDVYVSYTVTMSTLDGLSYRSSTLWSDLIVIENNGKGCARWVSTIPQGATIVSAYATLTSYYEQSGSANALLSFYLGDDATSLPSSAVDSIWTTQTSQIGWSITEAWPVGNAFDTADVASVLQPIVNRAGYMSGNRVMVFFNYNPAGSSGFRWAYVTPTLTVTYTA